MFRHVVMWKFKENAEGKTREENMDWVKSHLEALPKTIPFLRSIRVEKDVTRSDRSFDMVLFCEFDSPEDLAKYVVHPDHKVVSSYVKLVSEARGAVDYFD